jgi:succinate dehydrogenase / fumarate reductase iron-sulfur subunit
MEKRKNLTSKIKAEIVLSLLPQGKVEAARRVKAMVAKMDELGFGNCTNTGACEAECPKNVSISNIARLNRQFLSAKFKD